MRSFATDERSELGGRPNRVLFERGHEVSPASTSVRPTEDAAADVIGT